MGQDSFPVNPEAGVSEREDMFNRALTILGIDPSNEDAVAAVKAQAYSEDADVYENFAGLIEESERNRTDDAAELKQGGVAFVRDHDDAPAVNLGSFLE